MIDQHALSKNEWHIALFLFGALVAALFINLGIYPLFLEEPRRALIALEMIFSDNWIVPTQTGDLYFKKPPFYNWMLILSYKLFGSYSEFASRFVSVSSFTGMGILIFAFVKKYQDKKTAIYATLFFLVSVDILFYFSLLGEIDLFFSLIVLAAIFSIFHFGESKKYWLLFTLCYLLSAIGFLTKGLPAIIFLGVTLLIYFITFRKIKMLFSLSHLTGGLLFLLITAGYFYWYSQYHDPSGWLSTLWSESSGRTDGTTLSTFLVHFFKFPLDTLKNILPASLLIPLFWNKKLLSSTRKNKLALFLILAFLGNIIIYWISIGAKSRYIYALFPLAIAFLVMLFFQKQGWKKWEKKYVLIMGTSLLSIGCIACLALPFVPFPMKIDNIALVSIISSLASAIVLVTYIKKPKLRLAMLIACFIVLRMVYALTVSPIRAETSNAAVDKELGIAIAEMTSDEKLFIYKDARFSLATVFYIERTRKEVLRKKHVKNSADYFLAYREDLEGLSYDTLETFTYHDKEVLLVRFYPVPQKQD